MKTIDFFSKIDLTKYEKMFFSGAKNGNKKTLNVPVAWDIETSTNGKNSWMYGFSVSFDGVAYIGRKWDDFTLFLQKIKSIIKPGNVVSIFVHSLGFEYYFFKRRYPIKNAFFKSSRKPILVELGGEFDGIIFKDSREISGYSLADWAKACGMKVQKGEIDYSVIRTPEDELEPDVIDYMERDVLIIDEGIRNLVKVLPFVKKNIGSIPLTKTQIVKAELMSGCMASYTFKKVCRESENDLQTLEFMHDCFWGGSIGACSPYLIFDNVTRYDIASQYPFELLVRDFPYGKAETIERPTDRDIKCALESEFMFLIDFEAVNIERKPGYPKFLKSEKINRFQMTSVDFRIFHHVYNYKILRVDKITFWYRKGLLFPQIRNFIIRKYKAKTELKNIPGKDFIYQHEKGNLNTVAGLLSQFPIRDDFSMDGDKIKTDPEEALKKYYNGMPRLPYQIGLFMVAYARRSIWNAIRSVGLYRTIYFDTDCLDIVGNADDIIDKLNSERLDGLLNVGYHYDDISPADSKGIRHTIGFFEKKFENCRFCALSPKVYCVEYPDGKLEPVIGGCSLSKKTEYITSVEQFTDPELSIPDGMKSAEYVDEPFEAVEKGVKVGEKSYVTIRNSDFHIKEINLKFALGKVDVEI